jgi:hypothetical protein
MLVQWYDTSLSILHGAGVRRDLERIDAAALDNVCLA